jgi:hypothetical protein
VDRNKMHQISMVGGPRTVVCRRHQQSQRNDAVSTVSRTAATLIPRSRYSSTIRVACARRATHRHACDARAAALVGLLGGRCDLRVERRPWERCDARISRRARSRCWCRCS